MSRKTWYDNVSIDGLYEQVNIVHTVLSGPKE